MKGFFCLPLVLASLLLSCSTSEPTKEELIAVDLAFSKLSAERGMAEAFLTYASPDVVKLNPRQHPSIGIEQLRASFQQAGPEDFVLTWEPLQADVSRDIGYTFGNYFLKTTVNAQDTTIFGNYITVWKRQEDGSWKFVLDGGNPTPGPTVLEE